MKTTLLMCLCQEDLSITVIRLYDPFLKGNFLLFSKSLVQKRHLKCITKFLIFLPAGQTMFLFDGFCVGGEGEGQNDVMSQKQLLCNLSLLCGLFTKSMLLIFWALTLYSNSALRILKIIPPSPPPTKTLLFSFPKKFGLCK